MSHKQHNFHLEELHKEQSLKVSRRREIIKIREEISKIETKKQQVRSMKPRVDFLRR